MTDIFSLFEKIRTPAKPSGPITHLVVGLGNPGPKYENTRHNTGFLCLDEIAREAGVRVVNAKFRALTAEAVIADKRVLLMKPETMMNLSGEAVREAAAFYGIPPERILVICDDVNFEVGHIRIRLKGSPGGHNGLKNIESHLGSDQYPRVKVGVGAKPTPDYDLADWVLGRFPKEDLALLEKTTAPAVREAVTLLLAGKTDEAMCRYSK